MKWPGSCINQSLVVGIPEKGVTLGKEALCCWDNPWRLIAKSCVLIIFPEAAASPSLTWGNITVSHFGVTFVFPSKEKKELLWIRANSRECPPWIVWLLLGPIIWPRGEYRDRYILGHAHPCGQLAVQQGTWGGSPTKPHRVKEEHFPNRRGGGAITPRRGRGYNIWLTK